MANATAAGVPAARIDLSAHVTLWIVLAALLLCGTACLWSAGLQADLGSTWIMAEPILSFMLLASISWVLGHVFPSFQVFRRLAATFQDLFLSAAQLTALAAISGLLIYLAASAGAAFPMRDDTLEYFDSMLGFDWYSVSYWLNKHPLLDGFLLRTYTSLNIQTPLVLAFGSVLHPGQRNSEFIALSLVSILITLLVFLFIPAVGMIGKYNTDFLVRLLDIRAGTSFMDYNYTSGIITFPSYHTVLAILIPFAARYRCWSLLPALLVNIIMLASTSPDGGHYLVDILAGALVALTSIIIVRRCLVSYESH